ncbi:MAG: endonuclease [Rhodobacteraceae bacterium]|nr:endonuclease [Paracoccaceae bacterium]
MRIATYNVEWFANLFGRQNRLLLDDAWSGRENVTRAQQIEALAKVFTAINADLVMVVEAPNTGHGQSSGAALEHFAKTFDLRASRAVEGFENETHQEISLLHDPYTCTARHDPIGDPTGAHMPGEAARFDGTLKLDLDTDGIQEVIRFSKPPLEAEVIAKDGAAIRLIGVHVKSKAPHGATSKDEEIAISIANRRKQMAQCIWIRKRVEAHLAAGESVIVLGDLNDGPGLDEYETLFGHSGVEVVMGCNGHADRRLYDPHAMAAMSPRAGHRPATSRFYLHDRGIYLNALLDYIMVSPDLRTRAQRWQIWHPFDNPKCYGDAELREALLLASDHFPVTLDIDL